MKRPTSARVWARSEREQFWALVRAHMAIRRLRQADVAGAIGLDRTSLSRRLSGKTRERPSAWMVDRLVLKLRLDATVAARVYRLAGRTAWGLGAPGAVRTSRSDGSAATEPASSITRTQQSTVESSPIAFVLVVFVPEGMAEAAGSDRRLAKAPVK